MHGICKIDNIMSLNIDNFSMLTITQSYIKGIRGQFRSEIIYCDIHMSEIFKKADRQLNGLRRLSRYRNDSWRKSQFTCLVHVAGLIRCLTVEDRFICRLQWSLATPRLSELSGYNLVSEIWMSPFCHLFYFVLERSHETICIGLPVSWRWSLHALRRTSGKGGNFCNDFWPHYVPTVVLGLV